MNLRNTESKSIEDFETNDLRLKEPRNRKGVFSLFKDFSQDTTLHGFAQAVKQRPQFNQYRWKNAVFIVAIIFCLSITGSNLYYLISDYYHFPVTTSIVLEHHNELEFPAVTICNCNRPPTDDYHESNVSIFEIVA